MQTTFADLRPFTFLCPPQSQNSTRPISTHLRDQNPISNRHAAAHSLAILIQATGTDGQNPRFVQFLDARLRKVNAGRSASLSLDALDQDTVEKRSKSLDRPECGCLFSVSVSTKWSLASGLCCPRELACLSEDMIRGNRNRLKTYHLKGFVRYKRVEGVGEQLGVIDSTCLFLFTKDDSIRSSSSFEEVPTLFLPSSREPSRNANGHVTTPIVTKESCSICNSFKEVASKYIEAYFVRSSYPFDLT
jgi:hypothetical protein